MNPKDKDSSQGTACPLVGQEGGPQQELVPCDQALLRVRPAWLSDEALGEEGDRGEHLRRQLVAVPIMKVGVAVMVRTECVKAEVSEFSEP